MVDRELATREKIRGLVPDLAEVVDSADIDEDKYQCESCRVLSYLSHVTAVEGKKTSVSCPHHWKILPEGPKILRLRFSDDELRAMMAKGASAFRRAPFRYPNLTLRLHSQISLRQGRSESPFDF